MSKIKICGLFRECDIDFANAAAPDYIGFVFTQSRRQVSFETAKQLRKKLNNSILPIGVFVDSPIDEVQHLFEEGVICMAQLHGNESETYIKELKERCGIPVIKTIKIEKNNQRNSFFSERSRADFLLFDSLKAGSGKRFDWDLIPPCQKPFFLAGGIDSLNLKEALAHHPFCIDVSSGAETNGVKDKEKMIDLVKQVKETF